MSKSIPDKADVASINARVTKEELNLLDKFCGKTGVFPTQVTDIYKNREGRYTEVRIWSKVDLGTLRKEDLFITDAFLNPIEDFEIMDFLFEEEFGRHSTILKELNTNEVKEIKETIVIENNIVEVNTGEVIKEIKKVEEKGWDDLL